MSAYHLLCGALISIQTAHTQLKEQISKIASGHQKDATEKLLLQHP
jgi:hypothetical protein